MSALRITFLLLFYTFLVRSHPGFTTQYPWSTVFDASSYSRGEVLSANYLLFWNVDKTAQSITFAAVVQATGWVGLGLSDNGGMKGADIALLLPQSDGSFQIQDRFAYDFVTPELDSSQDKYLDLANTRQENGTTVFVFSRALSPCDLTQDRPVKDNFQWIIFAYSNSRTFAQHSSNNRGQYLISLITEQDAPPLPADVETYDLIVPQFTIPAQVTTYSCSYMVLPKDKKYHVVRVDPMMNNPLVHHILVYQCTVPVNQSTEQQLCDGMDNSNCLALYIAWGKGGVAVDYPSEAGLPMGAGDNGINAQYVLFQMHYNNPEQLSGQVDPGSGFRIYYTPTLREYDVGLLALGDTTFTIPAETASYTDTNRCSTTCLSTAVPNAGVIVLNTLFHMHNLGISAQIKQIRDNAEISPLGLLPYFDYGLQTNTYPPLNRTILPGDNLVNYCTWSSLGKNSSTSWGESTSDEMCLAFISYYPRIALGICMGHSTVSICDADFSIGSGTPKYILDPSTMPDPPAYVPTCQDVSAPSTTAGTTGHSSTTSSAASNVNHILVTILLGMIALPILM